MINIRTSLRSPPGELVCILQTRDLEQKDELFSFTEHVVRSLLEAVLRGGNSIWITPITEQGGVDGLNACCCVQLCRFVTDQREFTIDIYFISFFFN